VERTPIRREPQGAEVLLRIDEGIIRRNTGGWQAELRGARPDGTSARETFPTRVSLEMAKKDIPEHVYISFEKGERLVLLREHKRGKLDPIPEGTIGEYVPPERVKPLKGDVAIRFAGYGTYYIHRDDVDYAPIRLEIHEK